MYVCFLSVTMSSLFECIFNFLPQIKWFYVVNCKICITYLYRKDNSCFSPTYKSVTFWKICSDMGQAGRSFVILFSVSFSSPSPQHHSPRKLLSASEPASHPLMWEHRGSESINVSGCLPMLSINQVHHISFSDPLFLTYLSTFLLFMLTSSAILLHFLPVLALSLFYCLILQSCSEPLFNISHAALLTYLLYICSLIIGFGGQIMFYTCFPFESKSQISPSLLPSKIFYQC